ncbi:MAG: hypothetical protein KC978_06090 [Candidatus Omnitrophica bacterium]|nr:hypothetical protein [Candidatus Omnitrophota bacterium]
MDLIPSPDSLGLPAPVWLLLLLHDVTQTIHFLFMNFVLGGSWFLLWLHFGRKVDWKEQLYQRCLSVLPVALSMAITFGIGPLLFVQVLYGQFFYTANIIMGHFWLGLLLILVIAFYLIYVLKAKSGSDDRFSSPTIRLALHLAIALSFTLIALLHTANAVLVLTPEIWEEAYTGSLWGTLLSRSEFLIPRYLHNVVGAIGIGGLWIVWIGNYRGSLNASDQARSGAVMSLVATFIQMILGFWYLAALPTDLVKSLMRFDSTLGWHFASSILVAMPFTVCLFALTVIPCHRLLRWITSGLGALLVFAMVVFSEKLREVLLENYFTLAEWKVDTQWGPILIFLGLFVFGLVVLAWIAWALWKGFGEPGDPSEEISY